MHPDERYALAAIGHGHGGHHPGFSRGAGRSVFYEPWWPMYEGDVDGIYDEERDERLAEKIAARITNRTPTPIGNDGMDGFDMLGANTLTGLDWLNVFKNTAGQLTGSGDDKARAEAKAKQEKALAAEKSSKWKWAAGAALLGSVVGFFLGRK